MRVLDGSHLADFPKVNFHPLLKGINHIFVRFVKAATRPAS